MSVLDPSGVLVGGIKPFPPVIVEGPDGRKLALPPVAVVAFPPDLMFALVQNVTNNVVGTLMQPCSHAFKDGTVCAIPRVQHSPTDHTFVEPILGEQAVDA